MRSTIAIATLATIALAAAATATGAPSLLLDEAFKPRAVTQIEVGDFHFLPGQKAPIHTHAAPAYGYVSKGAIVYEIEGRKPVILKAGDAFFEPVGPRILKFDNASATEEAVFTDFNPERSGDPFIVFPKPPTEKIDRRAMPTIAASGAVAARVTAHGIDLAPGASQGATAGELPLTGYVAAGRLEIVTANTSRTAAAGESFAVPANTRATLRNPGDTAARAVSFTLGR